MIQSQPLCSSLKHTISFTFSSLFKISDSERLGKFSEVLLQFTILSCTLFRLQQDLDRVTEITDQASWKRERARGTSSFAQLHSLVILIEWMAALSVLVVGWIFMHMPLSYLRESGVEWHVHKDLCDKTVIPGFVRHLQAHSPLVENSQSPGHGSLARPSSQAITPWTTQTCNGGQLSAQIVEWHVHKDLCDTCVSR